MIPEKGAESKFMNLAHNKRLSFFKVPKEFRVVEELPKSSQGKILRKEVRKWCQALGA